MNKLKAGQDYYIIYEFSPYVGPSIRKARCVRKSQSERVENNRVVYNASGKFELYEPMLGVNALRLNMYYIRDNVFTEYNDACNKLNELKQNHS